MKYAIYGAGSLGTVLGAWLTRHGAEIELVNRNRAHVEALQKSGARVTGTVEFTVPVRALLPEQMQLLLFCFSFSSLSSCSCMAISLAW